MEGPYRDLGSGFARLTGVEGSRRGPSRINTVEDVLRELARNARDAGARNVYAASVLKARRYRTLTVLDDGCGIPHTYRDLVFEPGVTTRHLGPIPDAPSTGSADSTPHGAGLSLYHIRRAALRAEVARVASPTAIRVTFDIHTLPERALQSASRPSRSNLEATLRRLALDDIPGVPAPNLYLASPARILATILDNRIIHPDWWGEVGEHGVGDVARFARGVGLEISYRTIQRVVRGEVSRVTPVRSSLPDRGKEGVGRGRATSGKRRDGPTLALGSEEEREISAILEKSARASYLGVGRLRVEARAGEIVLKATVFEPEDEYDE